MSAVVVYESMFGNTQQVALAVATGLRAAGPVEVAEVGTAPALGAIEADLVVVGAPTHAFGLSRASTRADAATRGSRPLVSAGTGVREWLGTGPARSGTWSAAFDTHVRRPDLPGRAGRAAAARLARAGCRALDRAESFWVGGTEGPLLDGELERAEAWGRTLGAELRRHVPA